MSLGMSSRALLLTAPLLLGLLWPRPVRAFAVTEIFLRNSDGSTLDIYNNLPFLNQARCLCNDQLQVEIRFDRRTPPTNTQRIAIVAGAGSSCLDVSGGVALTGPGTLKDASVCPRLTATEDIQAKALPEGPYFVSPAPAVRQLTGTNCANQLYAPWNIFVYLMDSAVDARWTEAKKLEYTVATQPPDLPTTGGQGDLQPGESSVRVKVTIPGGNSTGDAGGSSLPVNLKGYQVLCEKIDASGKHAGFALSSPPAPAFRTPATVCPGASPGDLGVARDARMTEAGTADARPPDAGAPDTSAKDLVAAEETGPGPDRSTAETRVADSRASDGVAPAATGCAVSPPLPQCVCSDYTSSSGTVQVRGLQNGQAYRFYLVAVDNYYNASAPVKVGDATPIPVEDLWKRYQRAGGRSKGGFCFVATAAYGSYDHPQVRILRDFRDQVMLRSRLGQILVGAYYAGGAAPAAWLEQHPRLRPLARALLWPVTLAAAGIVHTSLGEKLLALGLLPLGLLLCRRRRGGGGR